MIPDRTHPSGSETGTRPAMAADVNGFLADCKRSFSLASQVPSVTRDEECCMGVDEAGRGPVLGEFGAHDSVH